MHVQIVAYDYGIKQNILRRLASFGCKVTVVPASYPAEKALAYKPDGIFFSNGPVTPPLWILSAHTFFRTALANFSWALAAPLQENQHCEIEA